MEEAPDENVLIKERRDKLNKLRELGINPYPYRYERTHHSDELAQKYAKLGAGSESEDKASIAGRIMQLRRMGKATFAHIQDNGGKIQVYFRDADLKNNKYDLLKHLDIGDFIGCSGHIFKTKLGEVTVYVKDFELLSKSLRPLPEKFHGLKDQEIKYRQRYLDMIMNPEVRAVFSTRAAILEGMREFMKKNQFIEVETPLLQSVYGGAAAKPFKTHCDAFNSDVFLSIAPELYLKKALVGGFDRVYEITKKFRNEGVDRTHNPEHMTIEWYQGYADYNDGMELFEGLMRYLAMKIFGKLQFEFQGQKIDLTKWQKLPLLEAIKIHLGEDLTGIKTDAEAKELAKKHGVEDISGVTKGNAADELMKLFRHKLIQPVFLIDYPVELVPLGKPCRHDPTKAEIFQPFIGGMELARAYSELNDPKIQEDNFDKQEVERERGNQEAMPTDRDFVNALEQGMPPACGVGVGIERIIMLFTNQITIRDVILFPFMKEMENGK